jgi:hypothetical protein
MLQNFSGAEKWKPNTAYITLKWLSRHRVNEQGKEVNQFIYACAWLAAGMQPAFYD